MLTRLGVTCMEFRQVKEEVRILGVDDARFDRNRDEWTRLIGVIHRGGKWIEGCLQIPIRVDGDDVTKQLTEMVKTSSHYEQLRVIMTSDTIFGGVNVLNIHQVFQNTGLPVIAISETKPNMTRVKKALQRLDYNSWEQKLAILEESGPIHSVRTHAGRASIYLQCAGLPFEQVIELVQRTATRSRIPEPVRVAHIIASSFVSDP